MKQIFMTGALLLGLVACGTGSKTEPPDDTTPPGTTTYPYNPAPSAVESDDPRVPYYGDWVWAAKLPDGTSRQGVLRIDTRGTPTAMSKNGGVGRGYLCLDENCETAYDASYGVINTLVQDGQVQLVAVFGDANAAQTTNRLALLDSDAKLTTNPQNKVVVAGAGVWAEGVGEPAQTVKAAFVQVDATPDLDFGGTLPDAFAQAKAAADGVVIPQRMTSASLLKLPRMMPVSK